MSDRCIAKIESRYGATHHDRGRQQIRLCHHQHKPRMRCSNLETFLSPPPPAVDERSGGQLPRAPSRIWQQVCTTRRQHSNPLVQMRECGHWLSSCLDKPIASQPLEIADFVIVIIPTPIRIATRRVPSHHLMRYVIAAVEHPVRTSISLVVLTPISMEYILWYIPHISGGASCRPPSSSSTDGVKP